MLLGVVVSPIEGVCRCIRSEEGAATLNFHVRPKAKSQLERSHYLQVWHTLAIPNLLLPNTAHSSHAIKLTRGSTLSCLLFHFAFAFHYESLHVDRFGSLSYSLASVRPIHH